MDKQSTSWRNSNSIRHYPLEINNEIPTNFILDAIILLEYPVTITRITTDKIYINDGIYWTLDFSKDYIYNDYGKLVLGEHPGWILKDVSVRFEPSACIYPNNLSLMGLIGDIKIEADIDEDFTLHMPESTKVTTVTTINNQDIPADAIIGGDKCNNIVSRRGLVVVDDTCLPPCYDCNSRLTSGDVHLYLSQLEDRVTNLEP